MKLQGGLLVVVLVLAGCHYAPDAEPPTAKQKLAFAEFNRRQAAYFDHMMDDLEEKMADAGAYTPGVTREPKNVYADGTHSLIGK